LNDVGIYIPPNKKNKITNDDINDISFTSYINNLSYINTVHKKLDEDLFNYVLNMSDKGYLNKTSKENSSKPNVYCDLTIKLYIQNMMNLGNTLNFMFLRITIISQIQLSNQLLLLTSYKRRNLLKKLIIWLLDTILIRLNTLI
jgi:hypothetical protein